jgi:hypothetical protein
MTHARKLVAGCAAALIVLFAVACAGQPDQTTAPADQASQPAQQAAPADQGTTPAAAAPAQGTAPDQQKPPAQGDQPHN